MHYKKENIIIQHCNFKAQFFTISTVKNKITLPPQNLGTCLLGQTDESIHCLHLMVILSMLKSILIKGRQ